MDRKGNGERMEIKYIKGDLLDGHGQPAAAAGMHKSQEGACG